jgi:hypothetical protein
MFNIVNELAIVTVFFLDEIVANVGSGNDS